jgi:hypothetical protein
VLDACDADDGVVRVTAIALISIVGQVCAGQLRVAAWKLHDAVAR